MSKKKIIFDWREESEEEKYQFMKEQIRPQKKRTLIRYLKKICGVVVLALMFGVVAGGAFVAMQNLMIKNEELDYQETMVNDTISSNTEEIETITEEAFNKAIDSLNAYQSFCESAALVGEKCNRYIVEVKVEDDNSIADNEGEDISKSGVIFKETTLYYYVLTHSDEMSDKKSVRIELMEKCDVKGEVLGVDYALGIAVLRVKKEEIPEKAKKQIEVAGFGNDLNLKLNTPIIVLGNPNGVFESVEIGNVIKEGSTHGIVDGDITLYSTNIKYYKEGNGFVTDIKGKLVGIITSSFLETTGEVNCAFIGVEKILPGINRLIEGRGIAYFGIRGVDLNEEVAETLKTEGGVYVSDVISGSPAYEAKIRVGDVIVKIDEQKIYGFQELRLFLGSSSSGDEVTVYVKRSSRNGYTERKMKVVLE